MKYVNCSTKTLVENPTDAAVLKAGETAVVFTGAIPGVRYKANIAAQNEIGWSAYSEYSATMVSLPVGALAGQWRMSTSTPKIFTIEKSGRFLVDGEHYGPHYDLVEHGSGAGLVIERSDGWKIDMAKSTVNRLPWKKDGEDDLVWLKLDEGDAAEGSVEDKADAKSNDAKAKVPTEV